MRCLNARFNYRSINSGERIELQDGIGQTVLDFRYLDSWYPQTDGDGLSLKVVDVIATDPNR